MSEPAKVDVIDSMGCQLCNSYHRAEVLERDADGFVSKVRWLEPHTSQFAGVLEELEAETWSDE